ncbi:MAG: hypothetical protein HXX13_07810 [Bacteroidetes bacterium]|nr:hypothetical protein [Bacteroidota bacterium]
MKRLFTLESFSLLVLLALGFSSCKDTYMERKSYSAYVPQYMSYQDMRTPPKLKSASDISEPGKIYIKGQYLFINEKYKGIHIYDNSNPASPVNMAFIDIPGNVDMAVKGDYLYADNYVDLLVMNISNIQNPVQVARMQNLFPYTIPEIEDYSYPISNIDQEKGVITGWEVKKITENVEHGSLGGPIYMFDKMSNGFYTAESAASSSNTLIGVGGSLARFIIIDNYFYGLNQTDMQVVDIHEPDDPQVGNKITMQRMVETVFIDSCYLFVGSQTGMLIYNVSDPSNPALITNYDHFQSCDPVVVQDNIAYITMRAGNRCGNFQNAMDVVDLHNISSPQLLKSYTLNEPYGLGIDNKKLFVCDGSSGLKVYDATDPLNIDQHLLQTFNGITATDVIPNNGVLILVAADGLYQYDYSDVNNLQLLSKISFGK